MGRRVYFAFHYEDVKTFRANVVRNCWVLQDRPVFWDASIWEKARTSGPSAIKTLIKRAIVNTSVTAVLIGYETYSRRWVRYEIVKSLLRGNGLLGIHINGIPDKYKATYLPGPNPFDYLGFSVDAAKGMIRIFEWRRLPSLAVKPAIFRWVPYADCPKLPLRLLRYDLSDKTVGQFSDLFPIYDWDTAEGPKGIKSWVECAAILAGR